MPKSSNSVPAKIKANRTVCYQDAETVEKTEDREIDVNVFQTSTATVAVKKGITKNLGNYESVRVDVMVSCPCYVEEIDSVYEDVNAVVEEMIEEQLRQIGE